MPTETSYTHWIKPYILFHGKRHPREMGKAEVEAFLTNLAVERRVAAATQPAYAISAAHCAVFLSARTMPDYTTREAVDAGRGDFIVRRSNKPVCGSSSALQSGWPRAHDAWPRRNI